MPLKLNIIGHLDMDAFFASIEERDHPRLKGRPIVVGSDPENGQGRGVVSTANYKAREYGIHSAMPISKAWQLAERGKKEGGPSVVFMGVDYPRYQRASELIMAIISSMVPKVEEIGIDELYIDLSFAGSYKKAREIARKIQKQIWEKEKLSASIGIGPNKMVAKIASDLEKPNGLTVIGADDALECKRLVRQALRPLPARKIPGVGPKAEASLSKKGVHSISDLQALDKEELSRMFGKWGIELYEKARGVASATLVEPVAARSIGEQTTLREDASDSTVLIPVMKELGRSVGRRFKNSGFLSFRSLSIIVRFSDFSTHTRSMTFPRGATSQLVIAREAVRLFMPFLDSRENPKRLKIRLLGVRIEKFSSSEQGAMI